VRTVDNGVWDGAYNTGVVGVRSYGAPITQYSSVPVSSWGVGSYAAHVAAPRTVAYTAPVVEQRTVVAAPRTVAYSAPVVGYSAPAVVAAPRTVAYSAPAVVAAPVVEQRTVVAAPVAQTYVAQAYAAPVAHAYTAPAAVVAAPVAQAYAAPVAHAYAAPAAVYAAEHSATYTAANRGSVHTAPLPGHAVSQTSLNVAPAPGTH
jgi:Cuticle protein